MWRCGTPLSARVEPNVCRSAYALEVGVGPSAHGVLLVLPLQLLEETTLMRARLVILAQYYTGLRPGELCRDITIGSRASEGQPFAEPAFTVLRRL